MKVQTTKEEAKQIKKMESKENGKNTNTEGEAYTKKKKKSKKSRENTRKELSTSGNINSFGERR